MQASLARFLGRRPGRSPHQVKIPATRFGQRERKHGLVAVDDIVAEQQRYLQPALFNRDPLRGSRGPGTGDVEHGTHFPAANRQVLLPRIAFLGDRAGHIPDTGQHVQLANLFGKRHL